MSDLIISKTYWVRNLLLGIFWVTGVCPFLFQLVSMEAYSSISMPLNLLADVMLLLLGLLTIRKRVDLLLLFSFLIISYISTCVFNKLSLVFWLNGMRYYFPLLFLLPIYRYLTTNPEHVKELVRSFDKSLFWFLVIQFPCVFYQFLLYGAGDHGGGSLGNLNSGVVSMLIYLTSLYLLLRLWDYKESYLTNLRKNWLLLFLLVPTFLNETKISFVLLMIYFVLLIPMDRHFFRNMLIGIPIGLVLIVGGAFIYAKVQTNDDNVFSWEYLEVYMMGDDVIQEQLLETYIDNEEGDNVTKDFARGAKYLAVPLILPDKPWTVWLGFGIGQFKGGKFLEKSDFAKRFDFLVQGTQMMGMIWLFDLGVVGIVWVLLWCAVLFRWFVPLKKKHTNPRLLCMCIVYMILIFLYTSNFLNLPFSILYIYICYLSARWNLVKGIEYKNPKF